MLPGIGIDLLMILLAGILLLVSMILSPVVTFLQGYKGQIPVAIGPTIQWILKYLLPFFLTCCMFFLIYKIIPNKRVHFTSALQAALFTGLLWELAKHLFTWYVAHLAQYSIFYGSLSTLVISFCGCIILRRFSFWEGSLLISWKKIDRDQRSDKVKNERGTLRLWEVDRKKILILLAANRL